MNKPRLNLTSVFLKKTTLEIIFLEKIENNQGIKENLPNKK